MISLYHSNNSQKISRFNSYQIMFSYIQKKKIFKKNNCLKFLFKFLILYQENIIIEEIRRKNFLKSYIIYNIYSVQFFV